jgi:hypothetical protein
MEVEIKRHPDGTDSSLSITSTPPALWRGRKNALSAHRWPRIES